MSNVERSIKQSAIMGNSEPKRSIRRKSIAEWELRLEWEAHQRASSGNEGQSTAASVQAVANASVSMKERFGGMAIDLRNGALNPCHSIRLSRDPPSNETDKSDSQDEKQSRERISTLCGIIMD
jgi:hypothetical protein